MKFRSKLISYSIFIFFFFLILFSNFSFQFASSSSDIVLEPSFKNSLVDTTVLTSVPEIAIHSDEDFEMYNFAGSGTRNDPFMIQNFIFTDFGTAIIIKNVTKYFVIYNNFLEQQSIKIIQVSHGRCNISFNYLTLQYSSIEIIQSPGSIIQNNTFEQSSNGVYVRDSQYVMISNNIWNYLEQDCAVAFENSGHSFFTNNTLSGAGIQIDEVSIEGYMNYSISHNNLNGKPIGYLLNHRDAAIDGSIFGMIIAVNCSFSTFYNLYFDNTFNGLEIHFCENSTFFNIAIEDLRYCGIYITDSKFLTFQNCELKNISYSGILVRRSSSLLFYDCLIHDSYFGMRVYDSHNLEVVGCIFEWGREGINLHYSTYFSLKNSYISDYFLYGIHLRDSNHSYIYNNTLQNSGNNNIIYYKSHFSIIAENVLKNSDGIILGTVIGLTIENNKFYNDGLYIPYYYFYERNEQYKDILSTYSIKNNRINDKELGFFSNQENIKLENPLYGQIFLFNCRGFVLLNQELSDSITGLAIFDCEDITIKKSNFTNNFIGIFCYNSNETFVEKNVLKLNYYGLWVWYSHNLEIYYNKINYNGDGVAIDTSNYTKFTHNTVKYNTRMGADFFKLNRATIEYNYFYLNNYNGMDFVFSTYNTIRYNIFEGSGWTGLALYEGVENTIYHNSFIDNNIGNPYVHSQVSDVKGSNSWKHPSKDEGNYYNDWDGEGSYFIHPHYYDYYPLNNPPVSLNQITKSDLEITITVTSLILVCVLFKVKKKFKVLKENLES